MPTIITAPSWNTTFDLTTIPKKFVLTDITDYTTASIPLTGVRGDFKITSPSGVVIWNNTSYGSGSDIVANVSLTINTIPLPNLANQAPEKGVYTITYTVQINDGSNPIYYITDTKTFNFVHTTPKACIVPQVDCISPLFTVADTTKYIVNGITPIVVYNMTLEYPANSGGSPILVHTTTLTTSTFYNGLQVVTIETDLEYVIDSTFQIVDTVIGTKSINVDCSFVCELYCCLKSLNNRMDEKYKVNDIEFEKLSDLFQLVMSKLELLFLAIDCGKQNDANILIAQIKLLSNCSNDCTCTDGTPSLVTGLGNLNNVNVVVQSGGMPIIVTPNVSGGVTTYTISFDPALVTIINNSYNTVVTNADGTITVTPTGIIGRTQTYDISANYVVDNRMEFLCRVQMTSPTTATIVNGNYLTSGGNITATATTVSTTLPTAALNNNFRVSAFEVFATTGYKVDVELILVTVLGSAYTLNSVKPCNIEVLNKTSGQFDFRLIDMLGNPITNTDLYNLTTDFFVSIKISL